MIKNLVFFIDFLGKASDKQLGQLIFLKLSDNINNTFKDIFKQRKL